MSDTVGVTESSLEQSLDSLLRETRSHPDYEAVILLGRLDYALGMAEWGHWELAKPLFEQHGVTLTEDEHSQAFSELCFGDGTPQERMNKHNQKLGRLQYLGRVHQWLEVVVPKAQQWFRKNTENLVNDVGDLSFVLSLHFYEHNILTRPILGNWILHDMADFNIENDAQRRIYDTMMEMILAYEFPSQYGNTSSWHDSKLYSPKLKQLGEELVDLSVQNAEDYAKILGLMNDLKTRRIEDFQRIRKKPGDECPTFAYSEALKLPYLHFFDLVDTKSVFYHTSAASK